MLRSLLASCVILAVSGCSNIWSGSGHSSSAPSPTFMAEAQAVPETKAGLKQGVADFVWEEPMVDTIEVPPSLDPEGVYYRPAHKAVVEIRQGRYRYLGE